MPKDADARAQSTRDCRCQSIFDHSNPARKISTMRPAIAHIQLDHLLHNFHVLRTHTPNAEIMAVVKADAYGHGLQYIAPCLAQAGCKQFAVTDADEGARLRNILTQQAHITLLSGLFDLNDAQTAVQAQLSPVITEYKHIDWLIQAGFQGQVWLKVDTGMQRLGASDTAQLIKYCDQHHVKLAGIMSHLACADTPEHPLNRVQADAFSLLHQSLAPQLPASLLNSAGIITLPDAQYDVIRPGLALYGAEPIPDQPLGLKAVMQLSAQVMQIHQVSAGSSLSYGASYTALQDMNIALICMGYADGLPRGLSNQGFASFQNKRLAIVGRVCMDYCLLDCTDSKLQVGDYVHFWGNDIHCHDVASQLNTIPYTLMTGVQQRVHRIPIPPKAAIT